MANNYSNETELKSFSESTTELKQSRTSDIRNNASYKEGVNKSYRGINDFNRRMNDVSNKVSTNRDRSLYDNTSGDKFKGASRDTPINNLSPIDNGRRDGDISNTNNNINSNNSLPSDNIKDGSVDSNSSVSNQGKPLNGNNTLNTPSNALKSNNNGYNPKTSINDSNPSTTPNKNKSNVAPSNNARDKLKQKGAEKALAAIHPALGAAAKSKKGKQLTQALSKNRGVGLLDKFKGLLPTNSNGQQVDQDGNNIEERNDEKRVAEGHAIFTKKQKRWILGGSVTSAVTVLFAVCILFVAVQALKTILGDDLTRVIITNPDISEKLFGGEDKLGEDSVDNNITELDVENSVKKTTSSSASSTTTHSSSSEGVSSTGSATIDKLNEIARGEVGKGPTEYRTWYYDGYDNAVDWCAIFVSWLFNKVDGIDRYIEKSTFAGDIVRNSDKLNYGTWYEDECSDTSTEPRAGDIIVFDPYLNGNYYPYPLHGEDKYYSSHVGYVYKVDSEKVYTVEGNSSNQVSSREYSRKNHCGTVGIQGINGYFRPNY